MVSIPRKKHYSRITISMEPGSGRINSGLPRGSLFDNRVAMSASEIKDLSVLASAASTARHL